MRLWGRLGGFETTMNGNIQLSRATIYFWKSWDDLFSGVGSKRSLLKLFNAHVLIKELQDEMTYNDLLSDKKQAILSVNLGRLPQK